MAITLTTTVDTMEPQKAPFVLNRSDIIPIVNRPRRVPDEMPLKAIPILNTPPSFSTTKTNPKQMQPAERNWKLKKFAICVCCSNEASVVIG